ncbi:hypothetical protein [Corynebacterium accolens]|uniref:SLAC1 family transporter n=1 Tax=Corynebacterium accolens TaxID=38284 RepID=UPI00267054F8|nr:hypothetical protein [Corynebacterium accolens]WKS59801.1 hypothetical protein NLL43_08235 [Corynebacterium accolens]
MCAILATHAYTLRGPSTKECLKTTPGTRYPHRSVLDTALPVLNSVARQLSVGVPLSIYAIIKHWGTALSNTPMSYNPTWWASTFPVGTCCLGTQTLSTQPAALEWGMRWMNTVSAALLILLLLHVTWAAFGAIKVSNLNHGHSFLQAA